MSLREDLNAYAPRLRRYARALSKGNPGDSAPADDLVHTALMRALASRNLGAATDLPVRLYATVTQLHREACASGPRAQAAGFGRPVLAGTLAPAVARQTRLSAALMALPLDEREALLLVVLEGFDHAEAARILRISRGALLGLLTRARRSLDVGFTAPVQPTPRRRGSHLRLVTS